MFRLLSFHRIFASLLFQVSVSPFVQAQAGSTKAILTDDTFIDRYVGANPAFGDLPAIEAGFWNRAFLKFNISDIPEGAAGITAVLELYTIADGVELPHVVTAYPVENTTWNEYDPPRNVAWFHLDVLDTEYVANDETWYEWNVTAGVTDALSNSSDVASFLLCYPETSGTDIPSAFFYSKEGSITKIPKLTIIWESIIPDLPPNILMLLIVMVLSVGALVFRKRLLKPQNKLSHSYN